MCSDHAQSHSRASQYCVVQRSFTLHPSIIKLDRKLGKFSLLWYSLLSMFSLSNQNVGHIVIVIALIIYKKHQFYKYVV